VARRSVLAALAALAILCAAAPAAGAASPYLSPGIDPPGANDWSCRPTFAHPSPVVLVHGTFGDMTVSWNQISPALKADGYCVFALDYGNRGTGPIEDSAQQLADFVDRVLAATRARKVSIVGHSQGGMMPRYWIKFLGGISKVDDLIGLAPSNHGTTNPFAIPAGYIGCDSCVQQAAGSDFLTDLNAGDETPGTISYTVVETNHDEVVTPYTSAFLSGPRTTNILLQDLCPADPVEHLTIVGDAVARRWVENALGRRGPADPSFRPSCNSLF
jgi:triacylglycerol lipase